MNAGAWLVTLASPPSFSSAGLGSSCIIVIRCPGTASRDLWDLSRLTLSEPALLISRVSPEEGTERVSYCFDDASDATDIIRPSTYDWSNRATVCDISGVRIEDGAVARVRHLSEIPTAHPEEYSSYGDLRRELPNERRTSTDPVNERYSSQPTVTIRHHTCSGRHPATTPDTTPHTTPKPTPCPTRTSPAASTTP